jgi:calcineurin-like phosphoesterase family protein
MTVYVWSDLHLGHNNILNYRDNFSSLQEHKEFIVNQYCSIITKRDKIFLLGDVAFDLASLKLIKSLPGYKHLILGNHDLERGPKFTDLVGVYDKVDAMVKYKNLWLTHAPIHPEELRGKKYVHGHTHNVIIEDQRYINVCIEHAPRPVPIEHIINGTFKTFTPSVGASSAVSSS